MSALLRSDGRFLPVQTVRKMALLGHLPVDQIKIETAAQIDLLLAKGGVAYRMWIRMGTCISLSRFGVRWLT